MVTATNHECRFVITDKTLCCTQFDKEGYIRDSTEIELTDENRYRLLSTVDGIINKAGDYRVYLNDKQVDSRIALIY